MARVAWRVFITARQFKQKPRKLGASVTHRLAVGSLPPSGSLQEPKIHYIGMSRLAAMSDPLGGFWEFPETQKNLQNKQSISIQFNIHFMQSILEHKLTSKTPLTWIP